MSSQTSMTDHKTVAQVDSDKLNLVTWESPDDEQNPKNWPLKTKWRITTLSSGLTFVSIIATSMTAPALTTIAKELRIHNDLQRNMTLSIFILGSAFGSLLAGPLSEIYGRRPVSQLFNALYIVFNIACGFATNWAQLVTFRAFAGFGGSAAIVIGAGILGDIWTTEQRGLSVSIYTSVVLLGPTIGPLLGGFVTQYASWRWSFWATSIAGAVVQVLAIVFWSETCAPVLLRRKAMKLRKATGNNQLHTKWDDPGHTTSTIFKQSLVRPFILLATQPIFQLLVLFLCYTIGLMYLALATFAVLWTEKYHESVSISGLNYLALAIGYIAGAQVCNRLMGALYQHLKRTRGGGVGVPEYRLPIMVPGALLTAFGLLWYGWSAQHRLHWIMPDIGIAIFAVGARFAVQSIQLYALDVYPVYAASASAASNFLRYLCGFTFPLFAPALYQSLGYGGGNSLLAGVAILVGLPTPILLWLYGATLRRRSPYASGD